MKTTETLDLLLDKLPLTARTAHRCPGITNNLLAVSTLCNAGCRPRGGTPWEEALGTLAMEMHPMELDDAVQQRKQLYRR